MKRAECILTIIAENPSFSIEHEELLSGYTESQLNQILSFSRKGYDISRYRNAPRVHSSYIRLQELIGDMSIYPILKTESQVAKDILVLLADGKDDYMYRKYAHKIDTKSLKILHSQLMNGNNLTRDLDYGKMRRYNCFCFLKAIEAGYAKDYAYKYLQYVFPSNFNRMVKIQKMGLPMEQITNILYKNEGREEEILSFIEYGYKMNFNPLPYLEIVAENFTISAKHLALTLCHTKGNVVPDKNLRYSCSAQYLNYIGYSYYILNSIESSETNYMIHYALLEIEKYLGISYELYEPYVNYLSKKALKCIIAGEDLLPYLNMNTGDIIDEIVDQLYDKSKKDLYDKFLILKLM